MKILGLTGGIGSGKTTVAQMFKELGIPVFIADDRARELVETEADIKLKITELFGSAAYEKGYLDRKLLADRVFSNKDLLEKLNAIVHPAVGKNFEQWKQEQSSPYVVYEAAILFEKGGHKKCDRSLLITAPHEVKVQRIGARDSASYEQIEARMKNQWPDKKKRQFADFVIDNLDIDQTRQEVRKIHQIMLEGA